MGKLSGGLFRVWNEMIPRSLHLAYEMEQSHPSEELIMLNCTKK